MNPLEKMKARARELREEAIKNKAPYETAFVTANTALQIAEDVERLVKAIEKLKNHKWWHWWFTCSSGLQYRFVKRWYGTQVQYRRVYCHLCRSVVKTNYSEEIK